MVDGKQSLNPSISTIYSIIPCGDLPLQNGNRSGNRSGNRNGNRNGKKNRERRAGSGKRGAGSGEQKK
jgi:hypothetical protein